MKAIVHNLKIRVDNLCNIDDYTLHCRFLGINHPQIGNPEDKQLIIDEINRRNNHKLDHKLDQILNNNNNQIINNNNDQKLDNLEKEIIGYSF